MLPNFESCVTAIADALVDQAKSPAEQADRVKSITPFLLATHAQMPDYLRLAFRWLTLLFDVWPYPTHGRPFHRLDLAHRRVQMHQWEFSRLEFRRGLMAFYKALTIFKFYNDMYREDYESATAGERN